MSDLAEAERFNKSHGLGDVIYTEDPMSQQELQDMFQDLGLGGERDNT